MIETILKLILILMGIVIILFILFSLVDFTLGKTITHEFIVIEKHYTSSNNAIGTSYNQNGVGATVISSPEKYTILIKSNDGYIYSREVNSKDYNRVKVNDFINITYRKGKFFFVYF